jgi:hypothetical protein
MRISNPSENNKALNHGAQRNSVDNNRFSQPVKYIILSQTRYITAVFIALLPVAL